MKFDLSSTILKAFTAGMILLHTLMAILLIGTTIDLLKQWVGVLSYGVGMLVAPILAPTLIAFPWFEAWVSGDGVNSRALLIWSLWVVGLAVSWLIAWIKSRLRSRGTLIQ